MSDFPTGTHSSISYGKKELDLLSHIKSLDGKRLSIRNYSIIKGIPRSTIYDAIYKLQRNELLQKENYGSYKITDKGKDTLGHMTPLSDTPVGGSRRECRKESLSTHYLKYHLPITSKEFFREESLKSLQDATYKVHEITNIKKYIVYYQGATVEINPKQMVIHVHDLIAEDVDEAHFMAFKIAFSYMERMRRLGIKTGNMVLSQAHYARVESHLSKLLSKVDNRYFLLLDDGSKFWIDYSTKYEDETNSAEYREKLDGFFLSLARSNSNMKDVDRLKTDIQEIKGVFVSQADVVNGLIKLHQAAFQMEPQKEIKERRLDTYFG